MTDTAQPMPTKITARDIEDLLAERHSKDVFVPQCKDGPTWNRVDGGLRMDAWAMRKSWAHPLATAYEIKVSRPDFLHDDKWRSAMALCNEFYWVAPPGVIDPLEIQAECGLLVTSKNGSRLFMKKRAQHREIEPTAYADVLVYILQSRTRIVVDSEQPAKTESWRNWLAEKDEKKYIGYNVSRKIRELVEKRIDSVQNENKRLVDRFETIMEIVALLEKYGLVERKATERGERIIPTVSKWSAERELERALEVVPRGLTGILRNTADALDAFSAKGVAK